MWAIPEAKARSSLHINIKIMAQATESDLFIQNKLKSLNATLNGQEPWKMDVKYENELSKTVERVRYDIEDGIIAHL